MKCTKINVRYYSNKIFWSLKNAICLYKTKLHYEQFGHVSLYLTTCSRFTKKGRLKRVLFHTFKYYESLKFLAPFMSRLWALMIYNLQLLDLVSICSSRKQSYWCLVCSNVTNINLYLSLLNFFFGPCNW